MLTKIWDKAAGRNDELHEASQNIYNYTARTQEGVLNGLVFLKLQCVTYV